VLPIKEPLSSRYLEKIYVDRDGVLEPAWPWRWRSVGKEIYSEWFRNKIKTQEGKRSHEIGAEAIWRTAGEYCQDHPEVMEAWWNWVWGSTPLFWRWPERYQAEVRDGQPHFLIGDFKVFKRPQKAPTTEEDKKRVVAKGIRSGRSDIFRRA